MPTVEVVDETSRFPYGEALRAVVTDLLDEAGLGDREVTIVLLTDEAIAGLNRQDRNVEGPTDVLSYPTHEPTDVGFPQVPHLGDVFISVDTAARQADAVGHTLALEIATLAAHGLAHLRGLDHQEPEDWRPFEVVQERARALMSRAVPAAAE